MKFCGRALPISLPKWMLGSAGDFSTVHSLHLPQSLINRSVVHESSRKTKGHARLAGLQRRSRVALRGRVGSFLFLFYFLFLNKTVMSALEQGT